MVAGWRNQRIPLSSMDAFLLNILGAVVQKPCFYASAFGASWESESLEKQYFSTVIISLWPVWPLTMQPGGFWGLQSKKEPFQCSAQNTTFSHVNKCSHYHCFQGHLNVKLFTQNWAFLTRHYGRWPTASCREERIFVPVGFCLDPRLSTKHAMFTHGKIPSVREWTFM